MNAIDQQFKTHPLVEFHQVYEPATARPGSVPEIVEPATERVPGPPAPVVRAPATANPAATSDVKPADGFEVDPVRSKTVDYESPVSENEKVSEDLESPEDADEDKDDSVDHESPGRNSEIIGKQSTSASQTSRGDVNVDVAVDLMLVGNKVDGVVDQYRGGTTGSTPPPSTLVKSVGGQRAGATRTSRGVDNSWGEINKASVNSRGDDVNFVLPPDDNRDNFVLHGALLLPEDDFILPQVIPKDTGQVPVKPPDECAKNYVSRGGSPHGIYGAVGLFGQYFLIKGGLMLTEIVLSGA